jgi:hypothetical protein
MATVYWVGGVAPRAATSTQTVTAGGAGTITATINGKVETYTSGSGDSVAVAATGAVAKFKASPIAEFQLVTWTNPSAGVILATGPADGRPVSISFGVSGACTISGATTAPASPNNLGTAANYSGGSVPTNGDQLVFAGRTPSVHYGLDTFASLDVDIIIRDTYTGDIGLNDFNQLGTGFAEFLPVRMQSAGLVWNVASPGRNLWRLQSTAASDPVVATITGTGTRVGVELTGLPAGENNVVHHTGGGLVIAPLDTDACHILTLDSAGRGTLLTGVNCGVTTATVQQMNADLSGTVGTLNVRQRANVIVRGAAGVTTSNVLDGKLDWRSTAGPGTVTIGSTGWATFDDAPDPVTVTSITMQDGGRLTDKFRRTTGYNLSCNLEKVRVELGGTRTYAIS